MERKIENAKIKDVFIGIEDHGFLTMTITLDYGGSCQAFGMFNLCSPRDSKYYPGEKNPCGVFIRRVLEIADVDCIDKLVDKTIRVDHDWTNIYRIGHILNSDEWFDPKVELRVT